MSRPFSSTPFVLTYGLCCVLAYPWMLDHTEVLKTGWATQAGYGAFFLFLLSSVFWARLLYGSWQLMPATARRLSPFWMTALNFIPVVNVIWWFLTWPALAREVRRQHPESQLTPLRAWGLTLFHALDYATWWIAPIGLLYLPLSALLHSLYCRPLAASCEQIRLAQPSDTEGTPHAVPDHTA